VRLQTADTRGSLAATVYLFACKHGNLEHVRALVSAGCDMAVTNGLHRTGLMLAAQKGHAAVVEWLVLQNGMQEMLNAHDRVEIKKYTSIFGRGTEVAYQGYETAFIYACKRGQLGCVQALVEAGCDTTVTDAKGHTGLMEAIHHVRVLEWLLEAGRSSELLEARG
jgi:ankyrin repeat protein